MSLLISGTIPRSADVLVHPPAPSPGAPPSNPTVYDRIRSSYTACTIGWAASRFAGGAVAADSEKQRAFEHAVRVSLSLTDTAEMLDLGFIFPPMAFDMLRGFLERIVGTFKLHA